MNEPLEDKKKSLERAKKSTISVGEIILRKGVDLLLPGVTDAYSILKVMVEHAISFFKDRRERRIRDFIEQLKGEADSSTDPEWVDRQISPEDYFNLLESVLQDSEDAKTEFYVKLFKAIASKSIEATYKAHFIRSSRELSHSDIELMRKVYIASRFHFKESAGINEQINKVLNHEDPLIYVSIENLVRLGYLVRDSGGVVQKEAPVRPSPLLINLTEGCFKPSELTPQAMGRETWTGLRAVINIDGDKHECNSQLAISRWLNTLHVQSYVIQLNRRLLAYDPDILILCLSKEVDTVRTREFLASLSKSPVIIKVLLGDSKNDAFDPVPHIQAEFICPFWGTSNEEWAERQKEFDDQIKRILNRVSS